MAVCKKTDPTKAHKPKEISKVWMRRNGRYSNAVAGEHICTKSPTGAHWWRLGKSEKGVCFGVCKFCGEDRKFVDMFATKGGK